MSSAQITSDTNNLITIAEPIFISNYINETGTSPTLTELKQYLVSHTSENLISILKNSDPTHFKAMSTKETSAIINLYIRKLRVF